MIEVFNNFTITDSLKVHIFPKAIYAPEDTAFRFLGDVYLEKKPDYLPDLSEIPFYDRNKLIERWPITDLNTILAILLCMIKHYTVTQNNYSK